MVTVCNYLYQFTFCSNSGVVTGNTGEATVIRGAVFATIGLELDVGIMVG